jgi:hypothetical protein
VALADFGSSHFCAIGLSSLTPQSSQDPPPPPTHTQSANPFDTRNLLSRYPSVAVPTWEDARASKFSKKRYHVVFRCIDRITILLLSFRPPCFRSVICTGTAFGLRCSFYFSTTMCFSCVSTVASRRPYKLLCHGQALTCTEADTSDFKVQHTRQPFHIPSAASRFRAVESPL